MAKFFMHIIFGIVGVFALLTILANRCHAEELITLTPENTVDLITEVSVTSVSDTILTFESKPAIPIYLYINSPGGDEMAGLNLVNYLSNTKKNIICIANYAASMAHAILEACPKRLGTENNILLQHKPSVDMGPSTPEELRGHLGVIDGLELLLAIKEADRIGISLAEFRKRTFYPWVTFGQESVKENLIDGLVTVLCSSELYKKNFKKETNACPFVGQGDPNAVSNKI